MSSSFASTKRNFFLLFCRFQFPGVSGWLPTAAGLGLIPFIVAPLDNLVEEVRKTPELGRGSLTPSGIVAQLFGRNVDGVTAVFGHGYGAAVVTRRNSERFRSSPMC